MKPEESAFKAVLFDLDGTLVIQEIDFDALRSEIGAVLGEDIITHIESLQAAQRAAAQAVLDRHESDAAARASFNEGAAGLLERLAAAGVRTGIVTRNSRRSVRTVCESLGFRVDVVVAREDASPKPSAKPVLAAAAALGADPGETAMVGDFAFDMESAIAAGAVAVYLTNGRPPRARTRAHFVIRTLAGMDALLRLTDVRAVLRAGPGEVTARFADERGPIAPVKPTALKPEA